MKSDAYGHAEGIGQLLSEEDETLTFGGVAYPCIAGDLDENKDLDFGGYALIKRKQVVLRKEELGTTTPPAAEDSVTLSGKTYHVNSVTTSPDGSFFVLNLQDPTAGV